MGFQYQADTFNEDSVTSISVVVWSVKRRFRSRPRTAQSYYLILKRIEFTCSINAGLDHNPTSKSNLAWLAYEARMAMATKPIELSNTQDQIPDLPVARGLNCASLAT